MEPLPVVAPNSIDESTVTAESENEAAAEMKPSPVAKIKQEEAREHGIIKRSMSELGGSTGSMKKTLMTSQSFPSLSDHVLRQLGLWLEEKQPIISDADQSEKEVENSFMALLLAFQTDRLTLTSRLELQTRLRDQAEHNMANEIQQLQNLVLKMYDRVEYLTDFQSQIDTLHKAALRVSSAAEIYGAVQQENRLSKAVDIILRHVENLKQAYHKEKTEHIETKRVLSENKPTNIAQVAIKPNCRRRATIAEGVASQNGTNLAHDIMTSANPLEAKLASTTGRTRPRYSLSQRGSAGKIETMLGADKQNDNVYESRIERRSSLIPSLIPIHAHSSENNCSHYFHNSDSQMESDIGEDSDGSVQDVPSVLSDWKSQKGFRFTLEWPSISWSTDELLLHARYGLAGVLLVAAVAIFCSTLYSSK